MYEKPTIQKHQTPRSTKETGFFPKMKPVNVFLHTMRFQSLSGSAKTYTFGEAVLRGVADDGGLFVPTEVPSFTPHELEEMTEMDLTGIAQLVLTKWMGDELGADEISQIVTRALDFPVPIVPVGKDYILELFHGPTLSFKDFSAKVMAQVLRAYTKKNTKMLRFLTATNGNSGGAVAHGFADLPHTSVVILYPKNVVNMVQKRHMQYVADNVMAIEIKGTFEDCQRLARQVASDAALAPLHISLISSVNIASVISQIVYFVYASTRTELHHAHFYIPSGNLSNACAALLAQRMGAPISHLTIACNGNDAVVEYYKTGTYRPREVVSTLANAMDIGSSSNFPRITHLLGGSHARFKKAFSVSSVTDSKVVHGMHAVWHDYKYMMDPHTAVAWVASDNAPRSAAHPVVIVSTASPLKFATEIKKHVDIDVDTTALNAKPAHHKTRITTMPNEFADLRTFLKEHFA